MDSPHLRGAAGNVPQGKADMVGDFLRITFP